MKRGLVSITFRNLNCNEIVALCAENSLKYVEWGGDIHIPAGNTGRAEEVRKLCADAGLVPVGYGSYYNAAADIDGFYPALDTAAALGAEYIRIWAGKKCEFDETVANNIARCVDAAASRGIAVTLECHRWTMTEDPDIAAELARRTGCRLHFQPNPDIPFERNVYALRASLPYLCACHVFAWEKGIAGVKGSDVRLPLSAKLDDWRQYYDIAPDAYYLMEFVKDNTAAQLAEDAETLASLASIARETDTADGAKVK